MTRCARRRPRPLPRNVGRTYMRLSSQTCSPRSGRGRRAAQPAGSPAGGPSKARQIWPRGGAYLPGREASSSSKRWYWRLQAAMEAMLSAYSRKRTRACARSAGVIAVTSVVMRGRREVAGGRSKTTVDWSGMPQFSNVGVSVACGGCGYDLRGLPVTGVCPECGRPVAAAVPACPRCDRMHRRVVALETHKGAGTTHWRCPICHGLGFEPGQLRRVIEQEREKDALPEPEARVYDLDSARGGWCSRCSLEMSSIFINDAVLIDRCGRCGFEWVDEGELIAVVRFTRSNVGLEPVPKDIDALLGRPEQLREWAKGREERREWLLGVVTVFLGFAARALVRYGTRL